MGQWAVFWEGEICVALTGWLDDQGGCASLRAKGLACLASCNSQGQLHEGRAVRSPLLEVRTRDFKEVSNSPEMVNPQS